jgi:hypothetical protein
MVDPKAQGTHDALDQMKNRLLPLEQPILRPLDPRTTLLMRRPDALRLLP